MMIENFLLGLKMELKDVIKTARLNKNLKQEEVAKKANVTVQTYRKWEAGKTEPKASQVALISKALSISTDAICHGEENKKLELVEFIRLYSKYSQDMNPFDQGMAIWDCVKDDREFLQTLKHYNTLPDEVLDYEPTLEAVRKD